MASVTKDLASAAEMEQDAQQLKKHVSIRMSEDGVSGAINLGKVTPAVSRLQSVADKMLSEASAKIELVPAADRFARKEREALHLKRQASALMSMEAKTTGHPMDKKRSEASRLQSVADRYMSEVARERQEHEQQMERMRREEEEPAEIGQIEE
ncbi:hypothetical protein HK102_002295 [Quaeritorhiza haematococci]|nr:hypothetical protein HK102_002295 [Quaeritorhiza haematococci]